MARCVRGFVDACFVGRTRGDEMLAAGAHRILAFISSMVILLPSLALGEEITMDDLVEREGLYFKKFTDVPFNGTR